MKNSRIYGLKCQTSPARKMLLHAHMVGPRLFESSLLKPPLLVPLFRLISRTNTDWLCSAKQIKLATKPRTATFMRPDTIYPTHRVHEIFDPTPPALSNHDVHCVSENNNNIDLACYNCDLPQPISIIFGTIVAKGVSYQIIIYFFTSPN